MACYRRPVWSGGIYLSMFALLLFTIIHSSSSSNDYFVDIIRNRPSTNTLNTLDHIMQLVSLGTGLNVPTPLTLRYREKSLKRARISPPHPRNNEYVIGSEFLGKRSSHEENKRMGSEFLGKRMGSEFLGKRMGSEFLGKRSFTNEEKRMGSEFLGKRYFGDEDKRMGSEFLGKRMGSEFLGKRMGSEFLGKRSESEEDYIEDYIPEDLELLGTKVLDDERTAKSQKRMGSEFLGRKKRQTKRTKKRV